MEHVEGRRLLQALVRAPGKASIEARAKAEWALAWLCWGYGHNKMTEHARASQALYRDIGDARGEGMAAGVEGIALFYGGDLPRVAPLIERMLSVVDGEETWAFLVKMWIALAAEDLQGAWRQAEALLAPARAKGERMTLASVLTGLGDIARAVGKPEKAVELHEESLSICRQITGAWGFACRALQNLGWALLQTGTSRSARTAFADGLTLARQSGEVSMMGAVFMLGLAACAAHEGNLEHAACVLGTIRAWLDRHGTEIPPFEAQDLERTQADVRARLGEEVYAAAFARGQALDRRGHGSRARLSSVIVQLMLAGTFPMEPVSLRPRFLQPRRVVPQNPVHHGITVADRTGHSSVMLHILVLFTSTLVSSLKSRRDLAIDNLVMRQQLAIYKHQLRRPRITKADRAFWIAMAQWWPRWREALIVVKPETVIAWHRKGFWLFWAYKSRNRGGRPKVDAEVRALVRQMSESNQDWGAPRIHGELLKLGFSVSQATVSRYIPKGHKQPPSQGWRTFLDNHLGSLASIDFFVVPTATFRVLFGFVVLLHERRHVVHFNVTAHPSAQWTAQQIVEAFPEDTAPRYMIRDRDSIYGAEFVTRVKGMGIEEVVTAPRSPWQNPYVERMIGSIRRDCLDHVIVLGE